jgi:hypothetical protein
MAKPDIKAAVAAARAELAAAQNCNIMEHVLAIESVLATVLRLLEDK